MHGSVISPDGEKPEHESYEQIILIERLLKALSIINPHIPKESQEQSHLHNRLMTLTVCTNPFSSSLKVILSYIFVSLI